MIVVNKLDFVRSRFQLDQELTVVDPLHGGFFAIDQDCRGTETGEHDRVIRNDAWNVVGMIERLWLAASVKVPDVHNRSLSEVVETPAQ